MCVCVCVCVCSLGSETDGINESYITILEEIYTGATARGHMDNHASEKIPVLRGVMQ